MMPVQQSVCEAAGENGNSTRENGHESAKSLSFLHIESYPSSSLAHFLPALFPAGYFTYYEYMTTARVMYMDGVKGWRIL